MTARLGTGRTRPRRVAWHDAEHGGFAADLPCVARLAGERPGEVLDLGAGTGRVALQLAAPGIRWPPSTPTRRFWRRSRDGPPSAGLPVETSAAMPATSTSVGEFPLVLAPMQLLHMPAGRRGAAACSPPPLAISS